jgi:hypothetical protein
MTQRQPWEKPPFDLPPRLGELIGCPHKLSGRQALEARMIYQSESGEIYPPQISSLTSRTYILSEGHARNFDPWRDLTMFGQYVFFGDYSEMVNVIMVLLSSL